MKKHWFSLSAFLSLFALLHAQAQDTGNMVYNPSFESYTQCPQRIDATGVMQEADAWWQPTLGSSDYFNTCGARECSVPLNKLGTQPAHTGEAYCGIYCSQELYREYLQTELSRPLQSGRRYRVSFWVSLAEKSPHAVSSIGALLTAGRVEDSTRGILMDREMSDLEHQGTQSIAVYFEPQVSNPRTRVLNDTKEWMEISGEFTAKGGERFLTIGNFLPFNKSGVVKIQSNYTPLAGAYYYVDDVSVTCLDTIDTTVPTPSTAPAVGDIIPIWDIYFATDESTVLQQSYKELAKLQKLLTDNPSMVIELRGHTDNQGTVEYNQRLSEARAKAVVDYLVSKGIERRRLTWVGFGKSQPVADNASAEGRRKNRRVEYRIVSN